MLLTDSSLGAARRQLWPRYGHFAVGRVGKLDEFLDYYETWLAAHNEPHTPERFRHWFANDYCPGPFRAELRLLEATPLSVPAKRGFTVSLRATNRSVEPWTFATGGSGGIQLRYTLYTKAGGFVYRGHAGHFARVVHPGESIDLTAGFPPLPAGPYMLHADLLDGAIHRPARYRLLAVWLGTADCGIGRSMNPRGVAHASSLRGRAAQG